MKLSQLTDLLSRHPDAGLALVLPDGSAVARHFHVTEVGRVRKDFIDCGGTVRQTDACVLQVWVADDVEHRLEAGKLGKILGLAGGKGILGEEDLAVEVEYDVGVITQFAVASVAADDQTVTLTLAGKHTACLAADKCGVEETAGGSSCCSPNPVVTLGGSGGACC